MGLYDFPWSKEKQQQAQELEWGAEPAQGSESLSQGIEHCRTWLQPHPQKNPPLVFPRTLDPPPVLHH